MSHLENPLTHKFDHALKKVYIDYVGSRSNRTVVKCNNETKRHTVFDLSIDGEDLSASLARSMRHSMNGSCKDIEVIESVLYVYGRLGGKQFKEYEWRLVYNEVH